VILTKGNDDGDAEPCTCTTAISSL